MLIASTCNYLQRVLHNFIAYHSIRKHLLFAFIVRVLLIVYGSIHDQWFRLQYTDIDYHVFTDGSRFLSRGQSPFLRSGYRYTPFFACLTYPNLLINYHFAKYMFAAFDVLTGWLVYHILISRSVGKDEHSARLAAATWLYNPLPLIVATRGSNDSFVTSLVLSSLYLLLQNQSALAGLLFGFAVHCKLYPIIYAPILYLYLTEPRVTRLLCFRTLLPINHAKFTFTIFSIVTFALSTALSYHRYGQSYLNEAWLYHFQRQDLAHNFSPYFYLYQLSQHPAYQTLLGYTAFIPQAVSIAFLAFTHVIVVNRNLIENRMSHLFFALFMTTFLFVTFNKVCTSQYFLWYLCLLPLLLPYLDLSFQTTVGMLSIWLISQGNFKKGHLP